ncbi:MAG: ATP-binding cassette domain-containing protein, partial [Gemmataceae bacterium]
MEGGPCGGRAPFLEQGFERSEEPGGHRAMIHVEKLTKYFGPVCAVNSVSFDVERNEIVGLLGNNGAGKTTVMRMLTTFLPASS